MRVLAITILAAALGTTAAQALAINCSGIADSLARLRCYDAHFGTAPGQSKAAKAVPAEDPLIAAAKATVRKQLREPASASFQNVKIRSNAAGNRGVCGTVNARNAFGGMTGPKLFVFDGKAARVLVSNDGPENGTSLDRTLLGVMLGESLRLHDQFCKG